jgi:hypothetical protein
MKMTDKLLEYFTMELAEIIVLEKLLIPPGIYDVCKDSLVMDLLPYLELSEKELVKVLKSMIVLSKDLSLNSKESLQAVDVILCICGERKDYLDMPSKSFLYLSEVDLKKIIKEAIDNRLRILVVGGEVKKNISTTLFLREKGVLDSYSYKSQELSTGS